MQSPSGSQLVKVPINRKDVTCNRIYIIFILVIACVVAIILNMNFSVLDSFKQQIEENGILNSSNYTYSAIQKTIESIKLYKDAEYVKPTLCKEYFQSISEEFVIHKGEWIYRHNQSCTMQKNEIQSAYNYNSFGYDLDDLMDVNLKQAIKNLLITYKNVTEYYPNTANATQICSGHLLYDKIRNLYSIYTIPNKCYFKIFNTNEIISCFQNRNIWILHESLGREMLYFILHQIDSIYFHHELITEKLSQTYHNLSMNLQLDFNRISGLVATERQFEGLHNFNNSKFIEMVEKRIINDNYTEIVFGSIIHDIIAWRWYKFPPSIYYNMTIKSLKILCDIFIRNNIVKFTIYIWPGIMPPMYTDYKQMNPGFGWISFIYPIYVRTFLKAINDFVFKYPKFKQYIILIDTLHVSHKHMSRNYSDDMHYGLIAKGFYPNISTIVINMAGHILLNHLC